ncbi:E3 ubiquitin-protein ligase MARCHF6-like [Artemia franciscana]|uniref:E3 ubiquitin-protein ligase MARCHF6-like n=1 Tax=Artemia franciscana TaxID=6661 RepID=UPI0032D9D816
MNEDEQQADICRVCRSDGTPERPLFHPCLCTGSIKYIHQECLVQWLRYSKKEFCELCNHQFSFIPIYSPDMPKRLPIKVIVAGLVSNLARAVRFWMHYTLVALAWLGVVPLSACRIYRCLFTGSVSSVLTLPLDMVSGDNLVNDVLYGCVVVLCALCGFIGIMWLREQILHGGGPDWLEPDPTEEETAVVREQVGGANAEAPPLIPPDPQAVQNPERNAAEENAAEEPQARNGANEEAGWNPMDWERAAEELTWERLLGLDGSLLFLENVFWVASLNTLFILVFAFSPYHIGHFAIVGFKLQDHIAVSHFEGFVTTLCGYVIIGLAFVILHAVASLLRLKRIKRCVGISYVVVKVSLLIVAEIGLFPVICGWWLDVCSLSLVDASFKDRISTFKKAPGTSMFLHWLGGIMAVFYFASFVMLLREVVRPGLLWFLRNLNDPEFSPIQEMIHLPLLRHMKRFVMSKVIFGSLVLVIVKIPISIIKALVPEYLPFNFSHSMDVLVPEFSLELLVLQVILPCLLEQVHTRQWLLSVLRWWCIVVGNVLGIKSYLIGDENIRSQQVQAQAPPPAPVGAEDGPGIFRLGAAHQAFLQRENAIASQPYEKPRFFPVRVSFASFILN